MALINVVKKIEKARANLGMEANELVVAACTTNPKGAMKKSLVVGIGGVVGAAIVGRNAGSDESVTSAGMADRFVAGQHALVLTDQRLFQATLDTLTGKPKDIVAAWDRADIAHIAVEETRLTFPMTITFGDGSTVVVEGAKGTDPRALVLWSSE